MTVDEVREARQAAECLRAVSLDGALSDGGDPAGLYALLDEANAGFERLTDMDAVGRHWNALPRREQRVLILRFYGNQSQEEVAAELGISQMHVSRLQARALDRLRGLLLRTDGG